MKDEHGFKKSGEKDFTGGSLMYSYPMFNFTY